MTGKRREKLHVTQVRKLIITGEEKKIESSG